MGAGRPSVMTDTTLLKLEQAFAYDCTVEEACFYADIAPDTYYRYVKSNPEFSERVKGLRNRPVLRAREKVVQDIEADVNTAKWYLERKRRNEFATKHEEEISGDLIESILEKYNGTTGEGIDDIPKVENEP